MKSRICLKILLPAIILSLSLFGCSGGDNANVTIRIDLGLRSENAVNTYQNSIFDRVLRFFATDAKAQEAPSGITSIGLVITGTGMTDISETYSADTSIITLKVPAGAARVFQLTAYMPTGNYGGSATQDLASGQSVDIPITMAMQYANVTINPTFPGGNPASTSLTRTVNVRTSGQAVLSSSFTPGTAIQVPAGDSKDFEVLISTPSVTFRGTATNQTLTADAAVTVNVNNMTLYETKIVIPDYYNNRIVQITSMNPDDPGWNWKAKAGSDIGYGNDTNFFPSDIDFDSRGRIYISNDEFEEFGVVIRINDIDSTTCDTFPEVTHSYIVALAVV